MDLPDERGRAKPKKGPNGGRTVCPVCNATVSVKEIELHNKTNRHVKARNKQEREKRIADSTNSSGIYVFGIPPHAEVCAIKSFFDRFGRVIAIQRNENDEVPNTLVQFDKSQASGAKSKKGKSKSIAKLLLATKDLKFQDKAVTFRLRRDFENSRKAFECTTEAGSNSRSQPNLLQELSDALAAADDLPCDSQLQTAVHVIEATEQELNAQNRIASTLESWLSIEFPGCRLHPFGSSLSGLALRRSDLDVYLEIGQRADNTKEILQRVSFTIQSHPDVKDLIFIAQARVPIIKFVHIPTGVNVDISRDNQIAMENSRLIRALHGLDARFRSLFLILKFWSKCKGFTNLGLTSYALNLMVVFFLQTQKYLPGISLYQEHCEKMVIGCWNAAFSIPENGALQNVGSSVSSFELLRGFFQFFGEFDASQVAICPLIGDTLPCCVFTSNDFEKLPSSMSLYAANVRAGICSPLKLTPICLQDPFELNRNVTAHFGRNFDLFKEQCQEAQILCHRLCEPPTTEKPKTTLGVLFQLPSTKVEKRCKREDGIKHGPRIKKKRRPSPGQEGHSLPVT